MIRFFLLLSLLIIIFNCAGQVPDAYWASGNNRMEATRPLRDLLSFPNDAQDGDAISRNLNWLDSAFTRAGFTTQLLASPARPFLFASRAGNPALPTVLFYMHFDGQPVSPAEWEQESPYEPVLKIAAQNSWKSLSWDTLQSNWDKNWRIFARSASDDKGPIAMFLAALARIAKEGNTARYNIKLILDSEEEKGSPHLPAIVTAYKDLLKADRLVVLDGPRHVSNEPTLIFGCRGVAQVNLEVFGPRGDLHSGHYGNYAPNPAYELAVLLAAMKDSAGRVLVPGFYKGISVSSRTRQFLEAVPDNKNLMNRQIGIAREVNPGMSYQEGLQYPSLNILNISSGKPEAGTRNIVPSSASAELDIRLVPESDPVYLEKMIRQFLVARGYYIIAGNKPSEAERLKYPKIIYFRFTLSSLAFVTEPDSPAGSWLTGILERVFHKKPVVIRMAGGTVPIAPFIKALGIPAVLVPTVNPDNNQHAANENLRLGNYFEGISLIRALLLSPVL